MAVELEVHQIICLDATDATKPKLENSGTEWRTWVMGGVIGGGRNWVARGRQNMIVM
jgi:hypothetical protein